VLEHREGHHEVDRVVGDRLQCHAVIDVEGHVGLVDQLAGASDHLGRHVEADDPIEMRAQRLADPSQAGADLERKAAFRRLCRRVDQRLVHDLPTGHEELLHVRCGAVTGRVDVVDGILLGTCVPVATHPVGEIVALRHVVSCRCSRK